MNNPLPFPRTPHPFTSAGPAFCSKCREMMTLATLWAVLFFASNTGWLIFLIWKLGQR